MNHTTSRIFTAIFGTIFAVAAVATLSLPSFSARAQNNATMLVLQNICARSYLPRFRLETYPEPIVIGYVLKDFPLDDRALDRAASAFGASQEQVDPSLLFVSQKHVYICPSKDAVTCLQATSAVFIRSY